MTPVCEQCGNYIETSNLRWPGYCTPLCRDRNRRDRNRCARARARAQRTSAIDVVAGDGSG
jgi:hypothetical protein